MRAALHSFVLLLLTVLIACGGSGGTDPEANDEAGETDGEAGETDTEAPTILSVVRADEALSEGLTTTAPDDPLSGTTANAVMTVTFSVAMDVTTITSDNIRMICSDNIVTLDIASSGSDDTTWILIPESSLPPNAECTLTFDEDIANSAGDALSQTSYEFKTKCATSDTFEYETTFNFSDPTQGCWSVSNPGNVTPDTFEITISTTFGMTNVAGIELRFDGPSNVDYSGANAIVIYKTFSADDLEVTCACFNGDINTLGTGSSDFIGLAFLKSDFSDGVMVVEQVAQMPGTAIATSSIHERAAKRFLGATLATTSLYPTYELLKIEKDGDTFLFYYGTDTGFSDDDILITTTTLSLGDSYLVGLIFSGSSSTGGDNILDIDSFTVEGGVAEGQE